ncbi:MAG: hypothetical protein ACR2H6_14930 [Pyrinomonadaceae bacterium]
MKVRLRCCAVFALTVVMTCGAVCPNIPLNAAALSPSQVRLRKADALDEATIFGDGVISTELCEGNAAFTPDGNTLYFTKRTVGYNAYLWAICVSRFVDGRWGKPEITDPFITSDGSKLYFASDRPAGDRPRGGLRHLGNGEGGALGCAQKPGTSG